MFNIIDTLMFMMFKNQVQMSFEKKIQTFFFLQLNTLFTQALVSEKMFLQT